MHSPPPSPSRAWLLLLAGALLAAGCGTQKSPDDKLPAFRASSTTAPVVTDELHPLELRAREVKPEPGITDALRERHTKALELEAPALHFIALLDRLPDEKQWEALRERGLHRAAFLHGRGFIIRMDLGKQELDEAREALGALAMFTFEPEDRAPRELLDGKFSEEAQVEGSGRVRVAVTFFPGTSEETLKQALEGVHQGKGEPEVLDETTRVIETDVEGVRGLVQVDAVQDVTEKVPPLPLLDRVREITGAEWVQAADLSVSPPVYNGLSGTGVRISIGNESLDTTHEDFWNHDAAGNATTSRSTCSGSANSHGTHVAGIALGNGFLSGGLRRGMAPQATAVCFGNRPDVSNHSYLSNGNVAGIYDSSDAARDGYMSNPQSVYHHLSVHAVANQGRAPQYGSTQGYYSVLSPMKNALTVANIDSTDFRWGGSSLGPTLDGRIKPDISAPGSLFRFPDQSQVLFELDSITLNSGAPIAWGFNTPGNSEGWAATNSWTHLACIGARSWTQLGVGQYALGVPLLPNCRPYLGTTTGPTGAPLAISGASTDTISLRYRFQATPLWNREKGLLWWATDPNADWTYRFIDFPIIADGDWHTVVIPVGTIAGWNVNGIQLLRLSPVNYADRTIISTAPGNLYGGNGGSSMAAPAVTGATALLLEQIAAQYGVNLSQQGTASPFWLPAPGTGAPMPSTLKALLVHAAKDLAYVPHMHDTNNPDTGSLTGYHKGPDLTTGYGALDVPEAVRLVRDGTVVEQQLGAGGLHQYTLPVVGSATRVPQPLKVTLAWSDAPGSGTTSAITPKLVNDLDLELVDPNGQVYYPWTIDQPYQPTSANAPQNVEPEPISSADIKPARQDRANHLDNLEQVYVENPMPGTWTVRVRAGALGAPPQRYSMVLGTPARPAPHLSGGKLAWVSSRTSPQQIFTRANTPGAPVQQLTWGPQAARHPAWTPNGDYLAYITANTPSGGVTGDALVIVNTSGVEVARWHRPLNTMYATYPSWSWDARHIAFTYYDMWGCQGLAVLDFTEPYEFGTATPRVLLPATCDPAGLDPVDPEFSADGATVYFSNTADHPTGLGGVYRMPIGGGTPEPIHGDGVPLRRAYDVSVSPDGKSLVYNSELWRDNPSRYLDEELLGVDLRTGVTTQLIREPGNQYGYYAIGGDGEMVVASSTTAGGNMDLFLLENGTRSRFDIGDPSNVHHDHTAHWWKRAPRCIAAPTGLRAWYSMDGLQGTQFTDLAGGASGTATGATAGPGRVHGALLFDGVDDEAVVPDQSQLDVGTGNFTLAAWVKVPAAAASSQLVLLDKRQSSPLRGYHWVVNSGCMLLQLADGVGGGWSNYTTNVCVADGRWHHVAVTVTRNSTTGIQWYLDGVASTVSSSTARNGSLDSTSPLYIGRHGSGGSRWNGGLDEVLLFGRSLPATDVQSLFQAGPSGMCR